MTGVCRDRVSFLPCIFFCTRCLRAPRRCRSSPSNQSPQRPTRPSGTSNRTTSFLPSTFPVIQTAIFTTLSTVPLHPTTSQTQPRCDSLFSASNPHHPQRQRAQSHLLPQPQRPARASASPACPARPTLPASLVTFSDPHASLLMPCPTETSLATTRANHSQQNDSGPRYHPNSGP